MTVRIWSSDVSAWEAGGGGGSGGSGGRGGLGGLSPPLPSRHEIARIRTQHRSNVFQAFFVDPTDEGSELLTCAADGAVRSLSVPRAQRDRLLLSPTTSQGGRGGGANNNDAAAASATSTTTVESRLLFRHCGRAHKMALVPGSPCELATCGGGRRRRDLRPPRARPRRRRRRRRRKLRLRSSLASHGRGGPGGPLGGGSRPRGILLPALGPSVLPRGTGWRRRKRKRRNRKRRRRLPLLCFVRRLSALAARRRRRRQREGGLRGGSRVRGDRQEDAVDPAV